MMKEHDSWKAQCLEATEHRDTWKNRFQEVATGILPILDLVDPALIEEEPRTPPVRTSREMQTSMGMVLEVHEGGR